jgi:hypothetical protein
MTETKLVCGSMMPERYDPNHWGACLYDEVRERCGMSREEAVESAWAIRDRLEPMVGMRAVMVNRLDNPYMTEDARLCLINELLREYQAPGRNQRREAA